jgi:hypothetical protein
MSQLILSSGNGIKKAVQIQRMNNERQNDDNEFNLTVRGMVI